MAGRHKQAQEQAPRRNSGMRLLFGAAVGLRLAFLAFGEWMDAHCTVKYTDVDYHVFTDAAAFLHQGGSPYDRDTYRYTPFLAYLLLPNVWWGARARHWGKLLFCLADLAVGGLIARIVRATQSLAPAPRDDKGAEAQAVVAAGLWLLNPLVINFATRGSADAIVSALVLATVLLVHPAAPRPLWAGLFHGLAVHFKIYPIAFSLAYLVALGDNDGRQPSSSSSSSLSSMAAFLRRHVTRARVVFTLVSAGTFFALTFAAWWLHGETFLREGLLYHLTRTDNRHNFSPWFYPIYLDFDAEGRRRLLGLLAFLPQLLLLLATSLRLGRRDLPFCVAAQTLLFVAFNKVCTAQYFSWYFSVFPAALPSLVPPPSNSGSSRRLLLPAALGILWALSLGAWLAAAYQLEFQGRNAFFATWLASLAFLAVNVAVVVAVLGAWAPAHGGQVARGGEGGGSKVKRRWSDG